MKNIRHPSNNGISGPPERHTREEDSFGYLHFTQTLDKGELVTQSYWQPTHEERLLIERGHSIVLKTLGARVTPVDLVVELQKRHDPEFSEADHERVLQLIAAIRDSRPDSVVAYTNGSCFRFYLILKAAFPSAVAMYDGNHVVTLLGGRMYDIRGIVARADLNADPYELKWEPNAWAGLEHCIYGKDIAGVLHDMSPLPMSFKRAVEALQAAIPGLSTVDAECAVSNLRALPSPVTLSTPARK